MASNHTYTFQTEDVQGDTFTQLLGINDFNEIVGYHGMAVNQGEVPVAQIRLHVRKLPRFGADAGRRREQLRRHRWILRRRQWRHPRLHRQAWQLLHRRRTEHRLQSAPRHQRQASGSRLQLDRSDRNDDAESFHRRVRTEKSSIYIFRAT